MKKKAAEKYYIIIGLITGLLVVSISFYFFYEYFTQEEIDWQACRQSIYLRSISPEFKSGEISLADLKNTFPLKCKTEIVNIDSIEPKEIYKKISDVVAAGWYLYGEGEFDIVPRNLIDHNSYCMAFARISYTEESQKEYNEENKDTYSKENFVKYYHTNKISSGETYNSYLPLYVKSEGGELPQHFFSIYDSIEFYPADKDILAVYITGKTSKAFSLLRAILGDNLIDSLLNLLGRDDKEYKFIILIPQDKINELDCEFLTIPA